MYGGLPPVPVTPALPVAESHRVTVVLATPLTLVGAGAMVTIAFDLQPLESVTVYE